jgi:hypothetical protein
MLYTFSVGSESTSTSRMFLVCGKRNPCEAAPVNALDPLGKRRFGTRKESNINQDRNRYDSESVLLALAM